MKGKRKTELSISSTKPGSGGKVISEEIQTAQEEKRMKRNKNFERDEH